MLLDDDIDIDPSPVKYMGLITAGVSLKRSADLARILMACKTLNRKLQIDVSLLFIMLRDDDTGSDSQSEITNRCQATLMPMGT